MFNNLNGLTVVIQSTEFQNELCELQSDPILLTKKSESPDIFRKMDCKVLSPSWETLHYRYIKCLEEHIFVKVQFLWWNKWNLIKEIKWEMILWFATTNVDSYIETLMKRNFLSGGKTKTKISFIEIICSLQFAFYFILHLTHANFSSIISWVLFKLISFPSNGWRL